MINKPPNIYDKFASFELDENTTQLGHLFTDANLRVIQNYISAHAHDHLALHYDCAAPHEAAIQQSYIRGAIDALSHLVHSHYEVVKGQTAEGEGMDDS